MSVLCPLNKAASSAGWAQAVHVHLWMGAGGFGLIPWPILALGGEFGFKKEFFASQGLSGERPLWLDATSGASCWGDDGCVLVVGSRDHSEGPSPSLSSKESKPPWKISDAQCRFSALLTDPALNWGPGQTSLSYKGCSVQVFLQNEKIGGKLVLSFSQK